MENKKINKPIKNILIAAGGTGGHIYPGLTIAKELIKRGYQVSWIGSENGLEKKLIPEANLNLEPGLEYDFLKISGVRNKGLLGWVKLPGKLFSAVLTARKILKKRKIDLVISFGGFASGPAGIAARILNIPLFIHEQNAVLGMTNKILSRFATQVFLAFPLENLRRPVIIIGNPLRADILELAKSKKVFLNNRPLRVLITGGSQGSKIFNTLIPEVFSHLENIIHIRHQTGEKTRDLAVRAYENTIHEVQIFSYFSEIAKEYEWADLIICRAGALTVCEVAAVGIPAIFIPHPGVVDDHQRKNAEWLSEQGAGICCIQAELESELGILKLAGIIQDLNLNREKLEAWSVKAQELAGMKKEAVRLLCDQIFCITPQVLE